MANHDVGQPCPDHPERFQRHHQVLCREETPAVCYWEVQWTSFIYIAVAYKDISRTGWGMDAWLGHNHQSWSLSCSPAKFTFLHGNEETDIVLELSTSRLGVYVNHKAGALSFFNVSNDELALLHKVQTTFTQAPLSRVFIHALK